MGSDPIGASCAAVTPRASRKVVAHEAAETFSPPHDEMGRADDGQVTLWQRPLARCGQSAFFAPPEPRQR